MIRVKTKRREKTGRITRIANSINKWQAELSLLWPLLAILGHLAMREMLVSKVFILVFLFVAAKLSFVFPSPITAPAFLWSPDDYGLSPHSVKEAVTYQTISSRDLAKFVLFEGGWSNLVCSTENFHQKVDIALVFVGRKLQSSDLSKTKYQDPALLDLLKLSFSQSNFSMVFPYVALSEEKEKLENSLISGFNENCGHPLKVNHVAYMESCALGGKDLRKLQDLESFQDFVGSRMESGGNEKADLVFFCNGNSRELNQAKSEGEILHELVDFLDQSGASYSILYASDAYMSLPYPNWPISRFLAENTSSNSSSNTTICDGVCQIKASLLEGLFVGIVLLIILLSGLCCMMGIETPTRFEIPQDP